MESPNLDRLVGVQLAALLVECAGGLRELTRQPADNVLTFGKPETVPTHLSRAATLPHCGHIYHEHQMVQEVPIELKLRVSKMVAAKSVLAARVDLSKSYPDGSYGERLSEEMRKKVAKLMEPPPVKNEKPLPKPMDKASKKRGGRRFRAMKERYGMTEMRKRANRVTFGEIQEEVVQTSMGFTMGHAAGGGGNLRAPVVDQRTRVRMSKKLKKEMGRRQNAGLGTTTSIVGKPVDGTVSSITFGPNQVEIIRVADPKTKDADAGGTKSVYFDR